MEVVDVDHLGAEEAKGGLEGAAQPDAVEHRAVGVVRRRILEEITISMFCVPFFKGAVFDDRLLGVVALGGVEVVDPEVERPVDDGDRLLLGPAVREPEAARRPPGADTWRC